MLCQAASFFDGDASIGVEIVIFDESGFGMAIANNEELTAIRKIVHAWPSGQSGHENRGLMCYSSSWQAVGVDIKVHICSAFLCAAS